jgi:hypothetical protein
MTMMAGAVATHLVFGELPRVPVRLVFLLMAATAGWLRRRSALRSHAASPEQHAVV